MKLDNYKLAAITNHPERSEVTIKGVTFGPKDIQLIAGPCAIESQEQLESTAILAKKAGVKIFRACAFKARTYPYSFQGLGEKGLDMLADIGSKYGFITETEVMDPRMVKLAAEKIDIVRVGARNMQNFDLLKEMGKIENPVIIKNGMSATYEEYLGAAEYVLSGGNSKVILCTRGVRSFETEVRFTYDALSIPVLKQYTHLPILADPSHPAGKRNLVLPLARAQIASGSDGILVETHVNPDKALTDKDQQLDAKTELPFFIQEISKIANALGRKVDLSK